MDTKQAAAKMNAHIGRDDDVPASITSIGGVMPIRVRDRWTSGPVWSCDCGALLEAAHGSEASTTCDRCARRYYHQLIGQRAWKVTLLPRIE